MATKLEKTIKRELELNGVTYTVAVGPEGLKITQKGYRKGRDFTWDELVPGGAPAGAGGSAATTEGE